MATPSRRRATTLRNRAWRSATWLGLASEEGYVTDGIVDTYEVLAEGGAAMLVTGKTNAVRNHRTDRYSGANILPAILSDMRSKTSEGFLISMKINSSDGYPGGMDTEQMIAACILVSQAGCLRTTTAAGRLPAYQGQGLDAIEVSANGTSRQGICAGVNEGSFLAAAAHLAEAVDIPVVLVGGLRSLEFIDQVLNDTKIEYVSLSRPLIREPDLIRRWQQGDTAPSLCVSCNACYSTPGHQCVFNTNRR